MGKKPFKWIVFILVCVYLLGLFLFGWGIYQCKTFPQSAIIKFFGGDVEEAIFTLLFFGVILLIVGGIFVVLLYKLFAIKAALKASPELKAWVKVVSKTFGVNYTTIARTGQKIVTGNVFFIICEFSNGIRKNFRVADIAVYNTILENDTGVLAYKEHGQHTLFIGFQRQS